MMIRLSGLLIIAIIFMILTAACSQTGLEAESVTASTPAAAVTTPTAAATTSRMVTSTSQPTPTDLPPIPTVSPTPSPTATDWPATATPIVMTTAPPTASPTPTIPPATIEPATATATTAPPTSRTVRIGLHGRNDVFFQEADYQLIRTARIETLKMMSFTDPTVFARIKAENPDIEFIVRLYDERINAAGHPTPTEFAEGIIPLMAQLQPYAIKFEVGNEPNHFQRYEGWGSEDSDAESFNTWFIEVYDLLKAVHPWAELGYPALATPDSYHREHAWLDLTRQAIDKADWLGVHCYWQTPPNEPTRMTDADRGLCFTYYHEQFPTKPLEITEFDNDNVIWDIEPLSAQALADEYTAYYQRLFQYPYVRSASSFIMSSPDRRWDYFAWRSEAGEIRPIVTALEALERPPFRE